MIRASLAPGTYLALGDSYTIGEGVAPTERWPVQLAMRLRQVGIAVTDPVILARTGWTTDELAAAMDAATFAPPYALVTLLIGVNDQYGGEPVMAYRSRLQVLLRRAAGLAGGVANRVVVVSIPDWGATPFAVREHRDAARVAHDIDAFNAAARAEAQHVAAHWMDITAISRMPQSRAELVVDGLHPSGAQYTRWAEAVMALAVDILRSGREE